MLFSVVKKSEPVNFSLSEMFCNHSSTQVNRTHKYMFWPQNVKFRSEPPGELVEPHLLSHQWGVQDERPSEWQSGLSKWHIIPAEMQLIETKQKRRKKAT